MLESEKKRSSSAKFFILGAFITAAVIAMHLLEIDKHLLNTELRAWMEGLGLWGPVVYILIYAAAPSFMAPGLPLTVLGGVIFGPIMGVVYASLGATIGASIAFLVARRMGREWVKEKLKSPHLTPRLKKLDHLIEESGWKVVAFTRLVPLFPFNVLNYAFGLTGIHFRTYLICSFIFMLPGITAYVLFSSSIVGLFKDGNVSNELLIGVALIITLSLIPIIYKIRKRRLKNSEPRA